MPGGDKWQRMKERRLAKGVCIRCAKNTPSPGRRNCEPCLEHERIRIRKLRGSKPRGAPWTPEDKRDYNRQRMRDSRMVHRMEGTCPECGKANLTNYKRCLACRKKAQASRAIRAKRKLLLNLEKGLCTKCSKRKTVGKRRNCNRCLARSLGYKRKKDEVAIVRAMEALDKAPARLTEAIGWIANPWKRIG